MTPEKLFEEKEYLVIVVIKQSFGSIAKSQTNCGKKQYGAG